MTIPVLVPPTTAELAVPYLTAAGFKAYPTWLDLDNLVPGGVQAMQDDELSDVLLTASRWCVDVCENMRLDAHYVQNEHRRTRTGPGGRLYIKPYDIPVRAITALSYGCDPSQLTALALPDSSMWVEDGREVSFSPGGALSFTGPALQFGPNPVPGRLTYVQWSYVAGDPSTSLSAPTSTSTPSATVADPTGILPGDVLRIYDAGKSEALTVAATYAPATPAVPPVPTAIPLAANPAQVHAAGTGITGMPRSVLQAVICYTIALLMREDVSAEEPVSGFGPAARSVAGGAGGKAGGLVNDALEFLAPHRPTFRS